MLPSRQLAAIMFTDIVGYTALMGEDEQKAFDLLRKNRQLQKPIIEKFNGTWIKEIGDGVLASFHTCTDAVICAGEIQKACNDIDDLKLRIGIHLGEVVFEDNDVFGDGVNIASRLQALAPIGGIWISEAVYKNVSNQKEIRTRFVQEKVLKNVKEPVRIYEVMTDTTPKPSKQSLSRIQVSLPRKHFNGKRLTIIISIILLLAAIALSYWFFIDRSTKRIESIAVLPFVNESGNTDVEYLSDGMTETLISSLSQLPDLNVKPRSSVFRYKGKETDATTIGKELHVQAVLNGTVVPRGQDLALHVELVDAHKESVLWSADYKQPMGSLVSLQSEITRDVVQRLKTKLSGTDEQKLAKNYSANSEAYQLYLKGRFYWNKRITRDNEKAIEYFQQAISLDSNYALAYAGLADAYTAPLNRTPPERIAEIHELAMKAVSLDDNLAEAHTALASAGL
jgi:class 3 adenylate cyclase/TolB-like protein